MTVTDSTPRRWPKPIVAGFLGLLLGPLGLLYVRRPGWALAYLLTSVLLGALLLGASSVSAGTWYAWAAELLVWAVRLACTVSAVVLAGRTQSGARPAYTRWYGLASAGVALFAVMFSVRAFVFEPFRSPSSSMHPTLPEGTTFVVTKLGLGTYGAYGIQLPAFPRTRRIARADVITFRPPHNPETTYVSRVIGIPGDQIQYTNRQLTINGVAVPTTAGSIDQAGPEGIEYRYASEVIDGQRIDIAWIPARESRDADEIVPAGHFMVLGDSRDNARDSRYIGMIPLGNISGVMPRSQPIANAR